jgi:hypothetical protein
MFWLGQELGLSVYFDFSSMKTVLFGAVRNLGTSTELYRQQRFRI